MGLKNQMQKFFPLFKLAPFQAPIKFLFKISALSLHLS